MARSGRWFRRVLTVRLTSPCPLRSSQPPARMIQQEERYEFVPLLLLWTITAAGFQQGLPYLCGALTIVMSPPAVRRTPSRIKEGSGGADTPEILLSGTHPERRRRIAVEAEVRPSIVIRDVRLSIVVSGRDICGNVYADILIVLTEAIVSRIHRDVGCATRQGYG